MSERRRHIAAALVFIWLATVLIATYYVYKPVNLALVKAIGRAVGDGISAGILVLVGGGLGMRILGEDQPTGRAENIAMSTGLGLGLLSLFILLLGAVGGLRVWLFSLLLVMAALALRHEITHWIVLQRAMLRHWISLKRFQRGWSWYVIAILTISLPLALLPPTAWDSLVYHLTGPRLYVETGRLVYPLDLPYLGFPELGEMLFTAVLLIGRAEATQLISLAYGILLALGCYGVVATHWDRHCGTLAAAILFSAVTIVLLLGWPYVDVILMFYTLATFLALDRGIKQNSTRWLVIAGMFAGMAMGTKYTAVAVPIGALLVIALRYRQAGWRPALVFGATAGLLTLPWLIKNWALTGNPIYPFFFPGKFWDGYRAWWYGRAGTGLATRAPWKILLAPWFATVWGVEGGAGFNATIGPLFLSLTPLALLTGRWQLASQKEFLKRAALYLVPTYALWLVGIATSAQLVQTRLLFPIFPLLAILAAAGLKRLTAFDSRQFKLTWIVRGVISVVLILNLINLGVVLVRNQPGPYLVGQRTADDHLIDRLGWHYAAMQAVNELPEDSKVLFLWEPRSFYCQVECWPDALLDRWWHVRQTTDNPKAIAADWRKEGFTHLLLFNSGYQLILDQAFDPISGADQAALDAFISTQLAADQDFDGVYTLYRFE